MEKHIIKYKETSREEELEFYSNKFLSEKRLEFIKIEDAKNFPLIQQIFYLPFVKKVDLNKRSVYIEKLNILEWNDVKNELCKQIQDFLNEGGLVSQVESNKVSPTTVYAAFGLYFIFSKKATNLYFHGSIPKIIFSFFSLTKINLFLRLKVNENWY